MAGLWAALGRSVRDLLAAHPLWAIAAIMGAEELGIPSPITSDFLMILAGMQVHQGRYPLWAALVVQQVATLVGTSGLFAFSRRVGRAAVLRFGWVLHIGPATLERAEARFARSGARAVFLGRLIPGLRIVTPLAAGLGALPFARFLPAVATGAFLYILAFNALGYLAGQAALDLFERIALPTGALLSLLTAALVVALIRNARRAPPPLGAGGAAVAMRLRGLLAGLLALLATNGITGLTGFAGRPFGYDLPLGAEEVGTGLRLVLGGPAFLLVASLLGLLEPRLELARLTTPARCLALAAVPLALTLALTVPLSGHHLVALATEYGAFLIAIEVVRWSAFGATLGGLLGPRPVGAPPGP